MTVKIRTRRDTQRRSYLPENTVEMFALDKLRTAAAEYRPIVVF